MQAKLLLLDGIKVKNYTVDTLKTLFYSMSSSIQKYRAMYRTMVKN